MDRHPDNALLALGGELPADGLVGQLAARHALIVAADSAGLALHRLACAPLVVVGDLDSIAGDREMLEQAGVLMIHRPSQEQNDLEKALDWLTERAVQRVTVIGASGGMADHALNNFSILARYADRLAITLRDNHSVGYITRTRLRLETMPGDRVSLIPLPTALLTTSGLEWELRHERLEFGIREGASNRSATHGLDVLIEEGAVAVFHYPNS